MEKDKRVLISTLAEFDSDPDNPELSRQSIKRASFYLDSVMVYNEHSDKGMTTVMFNDGSRWSIYIDYCTFDEMVKLQSNVKAIDLATDKAMYDYMENK